MENLTKYFNLIGAISVVFIGRAFGVYDEWIKALIFLVIIDYITGVMSAIYLGKKVKELGLCSSIGFKGILKKFILFMVVSITVTIDELLGMNGTLRLAIIGFFISNEGISIIENAIKMDLPIPEKLVKVLQSIKNDKNINELKNEEWDEDEENNNSSRA